MDDWTEIDMRAQTWAENEWRESKKDRRIRQLEQQVRVLSAEVKALRERLRLTDSVTPWTETRA